MKQPAFSEIVERYCPYVNHNVPLRKGPKIICMEAQTCPIRAKINCKNDSQRKENHFYF